MERRQADFDTTREVLESVGIPILGRTVQEKSEAVGAAEEIGFPVVMKLVSPDIIHKTDVGVVSLDVQDGEAVERNFDLIMENARKAGATRIDGILVQRQARPGFELMIGARQDPVFGPVTMVGYGGRLVELFQDVEPGIGLLKPEDVERMLSSTLAGRVIDGFRGPPLDRAAVIDLTIKISRLLYARPEVHEVDLNPVILYPEGFAVVDARLILGDPVSHPKAMDLSYKRLRSLNAIFEARSVAVVGASRSGSIGGIILKNSSRVEALYPINPRRERLLGRRCYKGFDDLPEPVDVAVFAVPPVATIEGFEEFCEKGGKGAVIVSDGFAEIGRPDLEARLVDIAHRHDVVYIGPNGLGIVDNFTGLNTLFVPNIRTSINPTPGPIGVISQSGGVGLELLEMAAADNLRIGRWVSCGNASGVSIPELLAHMGDDPRIKIIAIYVEGLKNGLQFVEVGSEIAKRKPVIVIKGGMGGGAAATMSHTASLAGSFEAFKAACKQAGFYLLEELTEDPKIVINILSILTTQKPARNNRVGVVSVGGGAAILIADHITSHGMTLTTFSDETRSRLAELLKSKVHAASDTEKARIAKRVADNPLDLFGDADDERLVESIRILNRDPNTDIIVLGLYLQVPYLSEYVGERLAEVQEELEKPLIISARGLSPYVLRMREYMTRHNVHTYTVPMIKPLSVALDIWRRYRTDFSR